MNNARTPQQLRAQVRALLDQADALERSGDNADHSHHEALWEVYDQIQDRVGLLWDAHDELRHGLLDGRHQDIGPEPFDVFEFASDIARDQARSVNGADRIMAAAARIEDGVA